MPANFPTAADCENFLKSASYWPDVPDTDPKALRARDQAGIAVAAAIGRWEALTGYTPFLASPTADPVSWPIYWDASSPLVQFGNGVVQLLDLSLGGNPLSMYSMGGGYSASVRLMPADAPAKKRAYTAFAFSPFWYQFYRGLARRGPLKIDVTARCGYSDVLPDEAWNQIREYAALETLIGIENLQNIGSLSMNGFSKSFDIVGVIDQKTILATWGKDFDKVAMRYRRMIV